MCYFVGAQDAGLGRNGTVFRSPDHKQRGSCVSSFVHWESAVRGDRGRVARASIERRRTDASRTASRSRHRAAAWVCVRRLRGSGCCGRSNSSIPSAAIQGTAAGSQRGTSARRAWARRSAARRVWRSAPGGARRRVLRSTARGPRTPRRLRRRRARCSRTKPELRARRSTEEQAQTPAQGRTRTARSDQRTSGWPTVRCR